MFARLHHVELYVIGWCRTKHRLCKWLFIACQQCHRGTPLTHPSFTQEVWDPVNYFRCVCALSQAQRVFILGMSKPDFIPSGWDGKAGERVLNRVVEQLQQPRWLIIWRHLLEAHSRVPCVITCELWNTRVNMPNRGFTWTTCRYLLPGENANNFIIQVALAGLIWNSCLKLLEMINDGDISSPQAAV